MNFQAFLAQQSISAIVNQQHPAPLSVAIPFNGTRRWYLATFDKDQSALYTQDYLDQVTLRMREVFGWMFADGVAAVYSPIIGHALATRGEAYMQFGMAAITATCTPKALAWHKSKRISVRFYGDRQPLPPDVRDTIAEMEHATTFEAPQGVVYYGIFADQPLSDIITQTLSLASEADTPPSPEALIHSYYGAAAPTVSIWIGCDQPTVFDVPLVLSGDSALYFLTYPTPYFSHLAWRRVLYDYLFVRGDEETLFPENLHPERGILGLGRRQAGYWIPSQA